MSSELGQLFFVGLSGPQLTAEEKRFIIDHNIGGVILFGRNVIDPKQVSDLCREIQELRHHQVDRAPLFISIDMEGGRVHRFKPPFTKWPAVAKLGEVDNPTMSFHFANMMGQEMSAVGVNLDFAPSVDILTNPKNQVIGDRAVSSDPLMVEKHTSALVRGYLKAGIITCAKHFPGHGNTLLDSHEDLPIETETTLDQLMSRELVPFRKAFRSRVDLVLSAHIRFPQVDPEWPATLSEIFLKQILREQLKFRGLVITDDLGMGALVKHYSHEEIAVRALEAGVDLLLYCNQPEVPPLAWEAVLKAQSTGRLSKDELLAKARRVLDFKRARLTAPDPKPWDEVKDLIGHPKHLELAEALKEGRNLTNLAQSPE